jgi:hypothetical protein
LIEIEGMGDDRNFDLAINTAAMISDDRLRAQTLWSLVTAQRLTGDGHGADETMVLAETATAGIKSPLTRVWMFSEITLNHLSADRDQYAWAAFNRALAIAESIDGVWGRARALARLALALSELSEYVKK